MNYRLVAIEVGDLLKYDTTVNEVSRLAGAIFRFQHESFPNELITSQRARLIHDWTLTLAKQPIEAELRASLLIDFYHKLATSEHRAAVDRILGSAGFSARLINRERYSSFSTRNYHPQVVTHSRDLFAQGNFFHAVFESAKSYNKAVRLKAESDKDGRDLMLAVWGCDKGVLKLTPCRSDTDRNVQDGVKFLSAGLMQAIRNPTAHEPALDWPIQEQDCLDVLGFISFLFRQLDNAVRYEA